MLVELVIVELVVDDDDNVDVDDDVDDVEQLTGCMARVAVTAFADNSSPVSVPPFLTKLVWLVPPFEFV